MMFEVNGKMVEFDYYDEHGEYDEYELEREAEFEAIALLIREIEKQFPMDSIKRTVERMEAMQCG